MKILVPKYFEDIFRVAALGKTSTCYFSKVIRFNFEYLFAFMFNTSFVCVLTSYIIVMNRLAISIILFYRLIILI